MAASDGIGARVAPVPRPRNRRELILGVAAGLFSRDGYHATSMRDVAREVGVTSTALYRHFGSKHDLLVAAVFGGLDATGAAVAGAGPNAADVVAALARLAVDRRGAAALWQREFRYLSQDEQRELFRRFGGLVDALAGALQRERAIDGDDARFLAWCVLSAMASVSYHRVQVAALADLLAEIGVGILQVKLLGGDPAAVTAEPGVPGDATVDRLIALAPTLFVSRGFAAVTMEEIGAAAGIAGPSIYHHFAGKADLLAAVVDRAGDRLDRELAHAESTRGAADQLLQRYVAFVLAHPDLIGVLISETVNLPAEQAQRARRIQRGSLSRWAAALQAARPQLSARQAAVLVQATVTIVNDMARLRAVSGRATLPADLVAVGRAVLTQPASTRCHPGRAMSTDEGRQTEL